MPAVFHSASSTPTPDCAATLSAHTAAYAPPALTSPTTAARSWGPPAAPVSALLRAAPRPGTRLTVADAALPPAAPAAPAAPAGQGRLVAQAQRLVTELMRLPTAAAGAPPAPPVVARRLSSSLPPSTTLHSMMACPSASGSSTGRRRREWAGMMSPPLGARASPPPPHPYRAPPPPQWAAGQAGYDRA
eukprot:gene17362-31779_t